MKPVQRGFFCDDTSIQYPYKRDTIPMWLLGIYGGIGPVVIVCIDNKEKRTVWRRSGLVPHRRDLGRSSVGLWPSRKPIQCQTTTSRLHQNHRSNRLAVRPGHCHLFSNYWSWQKWADRHSIQHRSNSVRRRNDWSITTILPHNLQSSLVGTSMYKNGDRSKRTTGHIGVNKSLLIDAQNAELTRQVCDQSHV